MCKKHMTLSILTISLLGHMWHVGSNDRIVDVWIWALVYRIDYVGFVGGAILAPITILMNLIDD